MGTTRLQWGSKSLKVDVGLPSRLVYHDLYLGRKALVERVIVVFDLTKSYICPSFIEGHIAKGLGLRVADSHIVHISRFNPFGLAKLTTFAVKCKAYGGKPSVDLLRAFLNLGHAGNWLTLSNWSGPSVPKEVTKPITHIEGWKVSFFYIENKIVHSEYPELLLEDNKLDKKSFNDVIPQHAQEDPLYNQIATYLANVQTFPDLILYLAGILANNVCFVYLVFTEMDFRSFMIEGIGGEFYFEPERGVGDDEGSSPSTRLLGRGKKYGFFENETHQKAQKVPPQARKASGDPSDPLDVDSDPDIHELKDSADCHWVVAHVTLPLWKQHHKEDLEWNTLILDMRVKFETLHGQVNRLHGLEADRERLKKSETQLLQEVDGLKQDRVAIMAKVIPYMAMKLVCSDEMGLLVARLAKSALFHESDQAGDNLATESYPFLSEATADLYAPLEVFLSKKPKSLHTNHVPSWSKPSSSKAF
ncbi:hypothetical protein Tco_0846053 [Tanacetum coccineum]